MSVHTSVQIYVHISVHMSIHVSIHMSTHISAHMAVHMSHVHTRVYIRARKYLLVAVAYGTCTMPIWLTTPCPKILIVTLWDVLESGNAKKNASI